MPSFLSLSRAFHSRPLHPPSPLDSSDTSPSPTSTCCGWLTHQNLAAAITSTQKLIPSGWGTACPACPSAWPSFRDMNRTCVVTAGRDLVTFLAVCGITYRLLLECATPDCTHVTLARLRTLGVPFHNRSGTNAQHALLTFGQLF